MFPGVLVTPGYMGSFILRQRSDQCLLFGSGILYHRATVQDPVFQGVCFFPIFFFLPLRRKGFAILCYF